MGITIPFIVGAAALAGFVVIAPVTKYALDIYPYLYANTRCSSRLSLLLNKKSYEELLAANSKTEALAILEDSYYGNIVEHSKEFFSFSDALYEDLYKTFDWLSGIVPPALMPVLKSLNLRFEIFDIKNILNSIKENKTLGDLNFIENEELKLKLEAVKDFSSFTGAIENTPYSFIFQNKSLDNLSEINTLLDKFYIENLLNSISSVKDKKAVEPFNEYIKILIDLYNVRIISRNVDSNATEELVDGGNLLKEDLAGVTDNAQLESTISNSIYGEMIGDVNNLNIENGFFKFLIKQAGNIAAKYTIKSGAIVRFIIMKEIEFRNLNSIIKLKTENFSQENIRPLLIL
tara:strand:+ start:1551 stop:2591 length:1041 start_codon:yes stop_codon:yes gene_type:complete